MCLNCGSGQSENKQGDPNNLTLDDLAKAARATNQSAAETLAHMRESLAKIDAAQLQQRINQHV
jgi:hypothetical protein